MLEDLPSNYIIFNRIVQFTQAYQYAKSLQFEDEPDYDWLVNLFLDIAETFEPRLLIKPSSMKPITVSPKDIENIFESEKQKKYSG